jgi:hypothetical protein
LKTGLSLSKINREDKNDREDNQMRSLRKIVFFTSGIYLIVGITPGDDW